MTQRFFMGAFNDRSHAHNCSLHLYLVLFGSITMIVYLVYIELTGNMAMKSFFLIFLFSVLTIVLLGSRLVHNFHCLEEEYGSKRRGTRITGNAAPEQTIGNGLCSTYPA